MQITLNELKKDYGGQTVLSIDKLTIETGELVGIVGNNGAGKTTMLRLILDLIKADHGYVQSGEEKVHESFNWKKNTGSYLDEGFLIEFLTPEEYFYFSGEVYELKPEQVDTLLQPYAHFMGGELMGSGKYIRQLSTGNKQKAGIIAAMMVNPALLLLDEPFNYLDPSSQITIRDLLKQKNRSQQTTMLISSHNINHLAEICSRIILLEKGTIIKDIKPEHGKLEEIDQYFLQQHQR